MSAQDKAALLALVELHIAAHKLGADQVGESIAADVRAALINVAMGAHALGQESREPRHPDALGQNGEEQR